MVLTPAVIFGLGYEHWRSSFTGRGYLTHSLPVRGSTQALVKLGHAYPWTVLAVVVSLLLGLLVMLARAVEVGAPMGALADELRMGLSYYRQQLPGWMPLVFALLVMLTLLGYLAQIWFAAAVGSEGRMAGTGWGPVVVYIVLYLAVQLVMMVCIFAVPVVVHLGGPQHLEVHTANVLRLVQNQSESMLPLGIVVVLALMPFPLMWRMARSWDRKVSLA